MVVAPPEILDADSGLRTDLGHHAGSLLLHRVKDLRILIHVEIVLAEGKEDIFSFPDVTVGSARLILDRSAADAAVRLHGPDQRIDHILGKIPQFLVAGVSVHQGIGPDCLADHLPEGELFAPGTEEFHDGIIRHDTFCPVLDGLADVILEIVRESHSPGRKRLHHILHLPLSLRENRGAEAERCKKSN